MGSVARDIYAKGRQYDVDYKYTDDGIAALLKDVYRLSDSRFFRGDIDATTILLDLKMALDSDCLTPRMRQAVALYYFVQLTEEETSEVLGVTRSTVRDAITQALERIANEIENGGAKQGGRGSFVYNGNSALDHWLNAVAYNRAQIYEVPLAVINEILKRHSVDEKAIETLRQRKEGPPEFPPDPDTYTCLTEEQLKWRDRRVTYKPVIYPPGIVVGRTKVAIKDGGDGWRLEKRKIFKN